MRMDGCWLAAVASPCAASHVSQAAGSRGDTLRSQSMRAAERPLAASSAVARMRPQQDTPTSSHRESQAHASERKQLRRTLQG